MVVSGADFIAGCIGGGIGVIVGHPFDTVKVRLQAHTTNKNVVFRGPLDCLLKTVRHESAIALFKGVTSPLSGLAFINAIMFGVQGNVKRHLPSRFSGGYTSEFISGSIAGTAQSVVCTPMELARLRLQLQGVGEMNPKGKHRIYSGPLDALMKIYFKEGVRGVFRGFCITAVRDTPSIGLYFVVYEWICDLYVKHSRNHQASLLCMLLAGGAAGISTWGCVYPIDVIKTRVQFDGMLGNRKHYSSYACFKDAIETSGWSVLTRGLAVTMYRAFVVNAVTLTIVTYLLRWLGPDHVRSLTPYPGYPVDYFAKAHYKTH